MCRWRRLETVRASAIRGERRLRVRPSGERRQHRGRRGRSSRVLAPIARRTPEEVGIHPGNTAGSRGYRGVTRRALIGIAAVMDGFLPAMGLKSRVESRSPLSVLAGDAPDAFGGGRHGQIGDPERGERARIAFTIVGVLATVPPSTTTLASRVKPGDEERRIRSFGRPSR